MIRLTVKRMHTPTQRKEKAGLQAFFFILSLFIRPAVINA